MKTVSFISGAKRVGPKPSKINSIIMLFTSIQDEEGQGEIIKQVVVVDEKKQQIPEPPSQPPEE